LKLKEPPALPEVEQMNQAVQHDEHANDEPQHRIPPFQYSIAPMYQSGEAAMRVMFLQS
jgi:hypothetical protein